MIRYRLVGANGQVFPLDGSTGIDELGIGGVLAPPFEAQTQDVPSDAGTTVAEVRPKQRPLPVPLLVQDRESRSSELNDLSVSRLLSALNPTVGRCQLIAEHLNDQGHAVLDELGRKKERVLWCWYVGGADAATRSWGDEYQGWFQQLPLSLLTDDPYWQPLTPVVRAFRSDPPRPFLPLLPLGVGSGAVLGASSEVNDGDALAFPVVTIAAPGTSVTARNVTTGLSWTVNTTDARGELITVDTRPSWAGGGRAVSTGSGVSLYDRLSGALWPLTNMNGGRNDLELLVAGATPGETSVTFTYSPRYLGPV